LYRIVVMNVPVGPDKDDTATFPRSAGVARMPSASYHNSPLLWSSNVTEGGCKSAMEYIRQLNVCRGFCAVAHNISKPIIHWAILERQGIGRFFETAVTTCLRAASLERPCLVDTTVRDPFFTLRSFISMPLDLDVLEEANAETDENSLLSRGEALELQDAIQRLQRPGASEWSLSDFPNNQNPTIFYRHILPLVPPSHRDDSKKSAFDQSTLFLDEIIHHSDRTIISPNWGPPLLWETSTFENIPPSQTNTSNICTRDDEQLITQMHNYMFQPTKLAKELHKAYRRRVLGNDTTKEPYGAIHIRFHILRTAYKVFPKNDSHTAAMQDAIDTMASRIWKRILHQQERQQKQQQPLTAKWWLVSDNLLHGKRMTVALNANARSANSTVQFYSDNGEKYHKSYKNSTTNSDVDDILNRVLGHRYSSLKPHHVIGSGEGTIHHSTDPEAMGILGHETMATSIVDWMVLWESDCAIVTVGAFSSSGARGRSKVLFGNPKRVRRHMIQMYVRQPIQ
jgi:hypothetical protein